MAKQNQPPRSGEPRKPAPKTQASRAGSAAHTGQRVVSRRPAQRRRSNNLILVWVIGGVLVILVGLLLLNQGILTGGSVATVSPRVSAGTAWGAESAPVKIVEYSNFGCSHCKNFAENVEPKLREAYESGGKVRFEFKQFKLGSQDTADAANASLCAADQNRFWDYHDLLFKKQGISATVFSKGSLKAYAKDLALDSTKFDPCVDKNQYMAKVDQDSQDGYNQGVNGTPTFFINGQVVVGELSFDEFKAKVDAAIAAKS